MSRNRLLPLTQTAEHRAQQGVVQHTETVPQATGAAGVARPPGAGLSARERRVKNILLKELKRSSHGAGLTYNEHQRLEKTLDVAFIDAELAKMRKHLRWLPKLIFAAGLIFGLSFVLNFGMAYASGEKGVLYLLFGLVYLISGTLAPFFQHRSIRRKIFIYEALRELSDADEADVVLDDTLKYADLLIDQIVERELAADAYRQSLRSPRQN